MVRAVRDDLQDNGAGPDDAVFQVDLAQEFGETVAVHLTGEEQGEGDEENHAGQRQQGQEEQTPAALVDAEQTGAAIEDDEVDQVDEAAEDDVQQAGAQADKGGDDDHPGILSRQEFAEFPLHRFRGTLQPIAEAWLRKKSSVMPAIKSRTMAAGDWLSR